MEAHSNHSKFANLFKKIGNFLNNKKEKILAVFLLAGIVGLIMNLLDKITILYLFVISTSIFGLIYIKIATITHKGLLSYLPPKIKNAFLKRSIFDILMDIWYLPTITEYIKLLIKPVIYRMNPTEATKVLEDFDPTVRKFFLTKGIVNLFSQNMKDILVPLEEKQNNIPALEENVSDSTKAEALSPMEVQLYKSPELINQCHSEDISIISSMQRNKDILIEEKSPFNLERKDNLNLIEEESKSQQIALRNVSLDNDFRFYEVDDEKGTRLFKTVVLNSSEKLKNLPRVESNVSAKDLKEFNWDNFDAYYKKEAKKALKEIKEPKNNFFHIFSKRIQEQIISKVNSKKLYKAFVILLLTFIIQMIISRKARRWSVSLLQFSAYLAGSLGAGGTLYYMIKKIKK